ncbi:fatty acid desaturase [Bacillus tianshenii]|uniref:Fatty acid desaturase n=1 Tax=Sutcliffiella tianshenii TaxID=1463404 RepID=A0ABS2P4B0_9BACI|nr:fatty acid desaturase [Bacillus tianshenii]
MIFVLLMWSGVVFYWGRTTEYGLIVSIPHYFVSIIMFWCAILLFFKKFKRWTREEKMKNFAKTRQKGMLLFVLKFGFLCFALPLTLINAALTTDTLRYLSFNNFLIKNFVSLIITGLLAGWFLWMYLEGEYEEYIRKADEGMEGKN